MLNIIVWNRWFLILLGSVCSLTYIFLYFVSIILQHHFPTQIIDNRTIGGGVNQKRQFSHFFQSLHNLSIFFTQNTDVALIVCIIGGVAPLSLSSMLSRYNVSCIGNMMMDEV